MDAERRGAKHGIRQYWNVLGRIAWARYRQNVLGKWQPVFDSCELYCTFCVRAATLLEHSVPRMVSIIEEQTGKEFVITKGIVYKFTRVK